MSTLENYNIILRQLESLDDRYVDEEIAAVVSETCEYLALTYEIVKKIDEFRESIARRENS